MCQRANNRIRIRPLVSLAIRNLIYIYFSFSWSCFWEIFYCLVWLRGIASILYLLIATNELGVENHKELFSVIVLTVLLSTFAHGITAVYLSKRFAIKKATVK